MPILPDNGSLGLNLGNEKQNVLGDLDDVRTYLHKAKRAATLIYAHFKKEFGNSDKRSKMMFLNHSGSIDDLAN
jgi:hypothetical protein